MFKKINSLIQRENKLILDKVIYTSYMHQLEDG